MLDRAVTSTQWLAASSVLLSYRLPISSF
jgi:hypothetical protein